MACRYVNEDVSQGAAHITRHRVVPTILDIAEADDQSAIEDKTLCEDKPISRQAGMSRDEM